MRMEKLPGEQDMREQSPAREDCSSVAWQYTDESIHVYERGFEGRGGR